MHVLVYALWESDKDCHTWYTSSYKLRKHAGGNLVNVHARSPLPWQNGNDQIVWIMWRVLHEMAV